MRTKRVLSTQVFFVFFFCLYFVFIFSVCTFVAFAQRMWLVRAELCNWQCNIKLQSIEIYARTSEDHKKCLRVLNMLVCLYIYMYMQVVTCLTL